MTKNRRGPFALAIDTGYAHKRYWSSAIDANLGTGQTLASLVLNLEIWYGLRRPGHEIADIMVFEVPAVMFAAWTQMWMLSDGRAK